MMKPIFQIILEVPKNRWHMGDKFSEKYSPKRELNIDLKYMINLLKLKMRKYQHTCMLVNHNILNVLFDFGWLLNDGFGYYP